MKKMLEDVYMEYWDGLDKELKRYISLNNGDDIPTHPLLMSFNDEKNYEEADIKILIFGQETNDWEGRWGSRSISELSSTYNEFFNDGRCYNYGGYFWNTFKDYCRAIEEIYPNKKVSYLWNNILKLGKAYEKGTPNERIIAIEREYFPVIAREIEILRPDIVIFFTGPNYDKYIETIFKGAEFSKVCNLDVRKVARVQGELLPIRTFRTYHPRYLNQNNEKIDLYSKVKESILAMI